MNLSDAALEYAARGFRAFPCEPRGKRPAGVLAPHGLKDATDDLEVVRRWWAKEPEANIGLATGRASSVLVIDLDGEPAEEQYGWLLHEHGPPGDCRAPDGASVRTGSGWHLYFAPPEGVDVRSSASRLKPGIDVRGEGGYVIAPPSVHPSGRSYVWRDPILARGLPVLSHAWAELLTSPPSIASASAPRAPAVLDGDGTRYGLAALRGELERLAVAPEGTRNHTLNTAAFAVGSLVSAGHLVLDPAVRGLAQVAVAVGLSEHETAFTIESGVRAGLANPRPERAA